MPLHTRKVVRQHIEPYPGATEFALKMRERGWRVVEVKRKNPVAVITYEREERQEGAAHSDFHPGGDAC